ncbi:MAG: hypothetical protein AB1Z66_14015 [Candidatus Limnocylindrales bacterium]
MSRVVISERTSVRRAISCALSVGLLGSVVATPVAAQDVPPCDGERTTGCVLPGWAASPVGDVPSLFGGIEGVAWIEDPAGDAPAGGVDILGVGIARVDIDDPAAVRKSKGLLKLGKAKRAVRPDESVLVRVSLDRPPSEVSGGHASVHLATDIDGSRSNNVPAGIARPDYPFAGSENVYSLTWAATTGKTRLLASDLAKAWYKDKAPFAASWATPTVLDFLVRPQALGDGLRLITHAAGDDGGYDVAAWGPAAVPVDGVVGLVPVCHESSIVAQPYVIGRLRQGGQTVRNVDAPASWRGGASIPVDEAVRPSLEAWIEANDDDDGRARLATWVNLFEDGIVIRQRPDLEVALEGETVTLALELGLTRRGYNVLRDFEPASTGDERLDVWIEQATDAMRANMPPFRLNKKSGLLVGEGIGSCVPWFTPPVPEPAPAETAAETATPTGTAAAPGA